MGYQDNYANNVANIYQNLGNAQAQARLQQGAGWANAFGQIGQLASQIPGQMAQQKKDAQQQELMGINLEVARKNLSDINNRGANATIVSDALKTSMVNGQFNEDVFRAYFTAAGRPELVAPALKEFYDLETSRLANQSANFKSQADKDAADAKVFKGIATKIYDSNFSPVELNGYLAYIAKTRPEYGAEVARLLIQATKDPDGFIQTVVTMAKNPAPELKPLTQPPGSQTLMPKYDPLNRPTGEYGEPMQGPAKTEAPPAVGSFEDYVTAKYGPRPTPEQIASARRTYGDAGRPPTVNINTGAEPVAPPSDVNSQDIMSQAGLSRNGFLALTNPTMLPRGETRNRASEEVEEWARSKGIDTSTFQAQYAAFNKVLTNNTMRLNSVQNIEMDLQGTIENLKAAADEAGMDDLVAVNTLKLWLNGELNDANAINYGTTLQALVSDVARYNAASSSPDGDRNPLESDMAAARELLRRGVSSGGLDGVLKAVKANVANMDRVNKAAVTRAQKAVWTLFGVGDKYKPKDASSAGGRIRYDENGNPIAGGGGGL